MVGFQMRRKSSSELILILPRCVERAACSCSARSCQLLIHGHPYKAKAKRGLTFSNHMRSALFTLVKLVTLVKLDLFAVRTW
jgi:hypothetical protein